MPVYNADIHDEWEKMLLKEIEKTVKEIWAYAGKPKKVLLAVDGVVPMAKIRQQRVRRFKSVWLRQFKEESWDTNAITPGTEFMERLGIMLKGINSAWIVSGADEEGEGEHKIMKWLRVSGDPLAGRGGASDPLVGRTGSARDPLAGRGGASDPLVGRGGASDPLAGRGGASELKKVQANTQVVVYGLDADLILLSMLAGESCGLDLFLLREKQEFGYKQHTGEQEYQYLNIREFQGRLGLAGYEAVLNYIGYMSLMGNDFLPHSLTHKLSDDGHEFIMDCVKRDLVAGASLIGPDGKVSLSVLKGVFERWSSGGQEEDRLLYLIRKKREQATRGVGKGMAEEEGLALKWDVEAGFLDGSKLKDDWKNIYWTFLHRSYNVDHVCQEYVKGFQWIIDYYTGKNVNTSWIFPSWLPPLWSDLAAFLDGQDISLEITDSGEPSPIPQEQLAMVLPLESWGLIRDPVLRRLPLIAPQMWPKTFGFVSVGRKWLWECEARIPVLTVERVRSVSTENHLIV